MTLYGLRVDCFSQFIGKETENEKMTKFAAVALAALMAVSVTACGKSGGTKTDKGDGTYTVGICQLVEHPALDAATKGFKEALQENLVTRLSLKRRMHRMIRKHVQQSLMDLYHQM